MSKLRDEIVLACHQLNLQVDINFPVALDDDRLIHATAHIPNVGAKNGMLIFSSFEDISGKIDGIINSGYGYSVLSEPSQDMQFDLDSYIDMFRDWGWSGDNKMAPDWFRG